MPRKVLHVICSAGGGATMSTIALIEQLHQRGIESAAICHDAGTAEERAMVRDAVAGRASFHPLYFWNRKIRAATWKRPLIEARQVLRTGWARLSALRVAQAAREHGSELIHTNTILTPEGGIAARWLGLPHVWHLRELLGPDQPFRLPLSGQRLERHFAQHCSKLVANSHAAAAAVRPFVEPQQLEVVPNGIDLSRFERRQHASAKLVVAMVAHLTSRVKKHLLFVEAAARIPRSVPVEFRIYGHDPSAGGTRHADAYTDELHRRLRALGVTDRFSWPGYVSDPARVMADIDVLVCPNHEESFGRVAIEAMAAGLPVVGADGGGVHEIVQDGVTGLLVPPGDERAMTQAIERLLADPALREQLGAAGRARAEKHYSIQRCADEMVRVYQSALANPLAPGLARLPARVWRGVS